MLHTEHYSSMYATTLCKNCCIRRKMRSITSQFQGKPSYKHFRNHSIPVGKCSMLLCKIEFLVKYSSIVLKRALSYYQRALQTLQNLCQQSGTCINMRFTFESADSCLQCVQHSCKIAWQEPTVDSIDNAKKTFKTMRFLF